MTLLHTKLISPPEEEFSQFCQSRLEGLALTVEEDNLQLYKEAMEKGLELLRSPKEVQS
ncbi:MAG: hypothetical protein HQL32_06535 [Planctomycetes bacterium]|nr:hypothetical protein [Planctomycetota bacterium]